MENIQPRSLHYVTIVSVLFTSSLSAEGVQIRLVGSTSTRCSGRVEVYHNGSWGTVCDDDWDFNDTKVVCRQLDCNTRDIVPLTRSFGEGTGQIWLDDVSCLGNESSLTDCQHKGFGNHDCRHTEDVSVACLGSDIRLAGSGSTQCSGRVEVYQNGAWGTVCDDDWGLNDAQVVCRQLGCGSAPSAHPSAHFGQGSGPVWLTDVRCSGHEQYLGQCEHGGLGRRHCGHDKDVGVVCEDVQIKLVGPGSTQCSGRVEVYYNGTWGRVCSRNWNTPHAQVVCRQMGCETAQAVSVAGQFGEGTGPVWLDDVLCSGKESSLTQCLHHKSETRDCEYGKDVGVVCSGYQVRLAGSGFTRCSGRVEVYLNGAWGTVCDDDWDLNDAQVVCRQLGCGTALSAPGSAHFGQGTGLIWFNDVACTGDEETLFKCSNRRLWNHKCAHDEDAGVVCSVSLQEPSISVTSPNEGLTWDPEGAEVIRGYSFVITCSIKANSSQGRFSLMLSDSTIINPDLKDNNSASFIFPVALYEHQNNYTCVHKVTTKDSNSTETATISIIIKFPTAFVIRHVTVPLILVLEFCGLYFYFKAKKRQMSLRVSRA
ncbi:deleted in malignant brain tumors 1 protein-like [Sphaeramia orbicularis]|uniref:deleted in malignant brain tumors 1 protein-like n=1 Tax=Sphaeramia orbicularis TaxID=375764 RepID=UPI0011815705|nr:deleted in malignant brain tumors 1 protein-like [Sphaeramia orbicularis]